MGVGQAGNFEMGRGITRPKEDLLLPGGYGKLGGRPGVCRPSRNEGHCSWGLIFAEIMLGILLAAGNTHTRPMVISFPVLRW